METKNEIYQHTLSSGSSITQAHSITSAPTRSGEIISKNS
jgi:hypothetical protein